MDDSKSNKSDNEYERHFRQMISNDVAVMTGPNAVGQKEQEKAKKNNVLFVVLLIVAIGGFFVVIGLLISLMIGGSTAEEELNEDFFVDGADDAGMYKELAFSKTESNAPILVYTTVKNGEIVSTKWLEEFREASKRYAEKYNSRVAIPDGVAFGKVTVLSDLTAGLYPNENIIRFLLETSDGCARFDLYEDLSVIYDYEYLSDSCDSAKWNFLITSE